MEDLGTHLIDLMLWLAGAAPTEMVSFAQVPGNKLASILNIQARLADSKCVALTFNDSVAGGDFSTYGSGRLTIYGDQGLITADWTGFMAADATSVWVEREAKREPIEPEATELTMASAFVDAVLDGAPSIVPAPEAAYAVALIEAAYRSANEGIIVRIEDLA